MQELSVLIATFNRSEILKGTLSSICNLEKEGIKLSVFIADNNSTDDTAEVIRSFESELDIRYILAKRQGQSAARNELIEKVGVESLGEIVVFTDDDVRPRSDWLLQIAESCDRWPEHKVFGGVIEVVWPDVELPEWTKDEYIQSLAFAKHWLGEKEMVYDADKSPYGANYWLRRTVLEAGFRFDETVGPRPGKYVMGYETEFFKNLRKEGYEIVYTPHSVVSHLAQPWQVSPANIRKRCWRKGLSHLVLITGPVRAELLKRHPFLWKTIRTLAVIKAFLRYAVSQASFNVNKRVLRGIVPLIWLSYNVESLKQAARRKDLNG